MRRQWGRAVATVVTVGLAGATSACEMPEMNLPFTGSEFAQREVADIASAAHGDMSEITSMRLIGSVRQRGNEYWVDLHLTDDGSCRGSMRFRDSHLEVVQIGKEMWAKGDSGFMRLALGAGAPSGQVDRASRHWFHQTEAEPNPLCDLESLVSGFEVREDGTDRDGRTMSRGEETDLDGVGTVQVVTPDGGGHDTIAWVRTEAPHHVVRVESTSPRNGYSVTLSEFDAEVDVVPPADEDVVEVG